MELGSLSVTPQMPPGYALAPEPTIMDMICQFNKLKHPKFQGGADLLKYEEWIRRLENLFKIMECPDRFKVALATYKFEGKAEYWWETVKPRREEAPMAWERLRELMDAKYYPKDAKTAKEQEFISLKQGNMSLIQYMAELNELSRFTLN